MNGGLIRKVKGLHRNFDDTVGESFVMGDNIQDDDSTKAGVL